MSDSEDTDDLLLIPPDFFTVHTEPDPPYYGIVDSLIKQVFILQDRIEGIEHMSDVSLNSYCNMELDKERKQIMVSKPYNRRYYSYDDLYQQTSSDTTPQKTQIHLHVGSLPNSPNVTAFKRNVKFSTPQKNLQGEHSKARSKDDTEVLSDIDKFLSNVRTIQRGHTARNLERAFDNVERIVNKEGAVNQKLRSGKQDKNTMHGIGKQDFIVGRSNLENTNVVQQKSGAFQKVSSWQCGDNEESVPDLGAGAKNLLYKDQKHQHDNPVDSAACLKSIYQPISAINMTSTNTTLDKPSDSSSESTQLTALAQSNMRQGYDQKLELQEAPLHDGALNALDMHRKLLGVSNPDDKFQKKRGINTLTDNLGLLNLADIWGSGRVGASQTVQEERLRRQHCEQLIRELQARNLEVQEKLAVAVQVDRTKNEAIEQFKEILETASSKIEKLIDEKQSWELEVNNLKHQLSIEIDAANKKIEYYEKEASRSANLVQNTNEKITELEERCADLQNQLHHIELKFDEVQNNYQREYEKNQKLADILSQKEIELRENKTVLNNAREEVSHSRKAVEVCQEELTALKNECALLQSEARNDKSVISNLNEQKKQISSELQIYKANEKSLRDALEQSKHKLETTKVELRNFYQGQLEIIVENKRKEMQKQLDQERQNNVEDMKRKELSMAKTAANHIKEISEKCALETKLLEQKYQEEIRLYQMQLTQKHKEVEQLRSKLSLLPEKRAEIAKHLQKAMESQWNEALKMIVDRSSPLDNDQNLSSSTSKQVTSTAFNHDQDLRKLNQNLTEYDETPVSSRGIKQNETAIQKYIDMLLNRPPGNPAGELQDNKQPQNQQRSTWNVPEVRNQNKFDENYKPTDRKTGKPPWK